MRWLLATAMVVTAWGCGQPPAHVPQRPAKQARKSDAREATRRELEARLAKVEEALLSGGERWDALAAERLELTVALTLLDREPSDVRPPSADALVAKARERIQDLAKSRVEREEDRKKEATERSREAQRRSDEEGYGYELEEDPLGGAPRGGEPKRKDTIGKGGKGACAPGDPLCDRDQPAQGEPPPPPPKEDGKPGGVQAARVLPSAQGSASEVSRLVERHAERLAACVPHTSRGSGLRCEVRVRVDARGRFREPRVLAADLDPRVGSCIADVFRGMSLDEAEGESHVVTVPLWLPPSP